ncbi:tetratricopeptide repeat protein [Pelagicoccus sp. SDUM812003]|uniref:tetratricopeptide repeat protein n=1 Tax=Pelagicoccus sp. SDUM812003 TaxID=3041267 RepID=UPI00280D4F5D|nr:tetratricopeptide repeat protein [Pelagicoccus sp. SDUM812003]MDQ8205106.1 tetratricopeptide repeat protein [Pelagicoccus sp. SDUM812003]
MKIVTGIATLSLAFFLSAQSGTESLPSVPEPDQAHQKFFEVLEETRNDSIAEPSSHSTWVQLGQVYHANRFLERAEQAYQIALQLTSTMGEQAKIYYYLADIALSKGNASTGAELLETCVSLKSDYAPAWLRAGDLALKRGSLADAENCYRNCLAIAPDNRFAELGRIRVLVQNDQAETALPELKKLVVDQPDFVAARAFLAQLYERSGDRSSAKTLRDENKSVWDAKPDDPWLEDVWQRCYDPRQLGVEFEDLIRIKDYDAALAILDRLVNLSGNEARAHMMRGQVYLETERYALARDAFRKSIQNPDAPEGAYTYLLKALVHIGELAEAENVAREALNAYPDSLDILMEAAGVQMDLGNIESAVSLMERATQLDPYHALANQMLSSIYRRTGQTEKALESLERLRRVSPRDLYPRVAIGAHYLDQRQPENAIPSLQEAFDIEPQDDIRELLAAAYAQQGDADLLKRQFDSAVNRYNQALEIWPASQEAFVSKLKLLLSLERFEEAESTLQAMIEIAGDQLQLLVTLGDVQFKLSKIADAKASWEKAARLPEARGNPTILESLKARLATVE